MSHLKPTRREFCRNVLGLGSALGLSMDTAMADEPSTNALSPLAGVTLRYPEKTFYLAQVFKDTTNSYKLVWFLALLSLLKRSSESSFKVADVLAEMAVISWHPVCLYRLSLGRQDKLQDTIVQLREQSGLQPNADPEAIRKFVMGSADAMKRLDYFKRYVPTRFLAPWFAEQLRGQDDSKRDRQIEELARQSQATPLASPYWFDRASIRLNASWRAFLVENIGLVQSFAEYNLALYLQARNPNVPGVVNKLRAPTKRQLTAAQQFWRLVRTELEKANRGDRFQDIYSQRKLGESFTVDHFLPWSFVVHDLLWNLTPVEPATNSSKNDVLPDLNLYLPRLSKLHFNAIDIARKRPALLEDYVDCFKLDPNEMLALGEDGFTTKYRELILPQAQIAANQGFKAGWKFRN